MSGSAEAETNWRGRRVLVTGASGFVGSHLAEQLVTRGARVRTLVHYNSRRELGNLRWLPADVRSELEIVYGDLQELETVRTAVRGSDVVFHLAALVGIPYSYERPQEVVQVNTVGTLNVLLAARDAGVSRLVQTSTSEAYGTARQVPMDENHPRQPQSPYSASKIASDAIALSFHRSFELPVAVIRPFNTYGPRQSQRAVIPAIAAQALTRDEIQLGSLTPTRDFTFVLDLVEAFIRMAECDAAIGREVNVGTGSEISIGELAEKIVAIVGRDTKVVQDPQRVRPSGSEVERLLCDASLARELIGWEPRTSIGEGLRQVVEFLRPVVDPARTGEYAV